MGGVREAGHVGADLRQQHLRLLAVAHGASERALAAGECLLTAEDRAALGLPPLAIPWCPQGLPPRSVNGT